jgi:hypothetical protein
MPSRQASLARWGVGCTEFPALQAPRPLAVNGLRPQQASASSGVSESAGIRLGALLASWLRNPSTIKRGDWER